MSKGEVSAGTSLSFDDARSRSARPNERNLECRFRRTSNVIVPNHLNFTIFAGGSPFKAIRAINACKRQADPIPASSSWNGRRALSLNFPAPGHYAAPAKRSRTRCLPTALKGRRLGAVSPMDTRIRWHRSGLCDPWSAQGERPGKARASGRILEWAVRRSTLKSTGANFKDAGNLWCHFLGERSQSLQLRMFPRR